MKYDYTFFQENRLLLQNQNFEQYKNLSIFELLINLLNEEIIYEYYEVDWSLFATDFVDYKIQHNKDLPYDSERIIKGDKLEKVCQRIVSRSVTIKLLLFFQRNTTLIWPQWDNTDYIEQECARLISENIFQSRYDQYHGDFANMPRPNYRQMLVDPNIFQEQTYEHKWIEQYIYKKNTNVPNYTTLPKAIKEIQNLQNRVAELTEENQKLRAQLEKPLPQNKITKVEKYKTQEFYKKVQEAPLFNEAYFRSDLTETQSAYIDKEIKVACSKRKAGVAVAAVLNNPSNKATYLAIADVANTDLYFSLVKTYGLTVAPSSFYDAMRKSQKIVNNRNLS